MALSKKKVSFDIGSQISAMNGEGQMSTAVPSETVASPAAESNGIKYGQIVTEKQELAKKKQSDTSVLVGFKLPKEAKEQYREFFEGYGLNLSEAMKNALEYFASDVEKGKVKITLTRHFERVEE